MRGLKIYFFVLLFFSEVYAAPLQYNLNNEYSLNYTVGDVELFNLEHQSSFLSTLPKSEFDIKLPKIQSNIVKEGAVKRASELNTELQTEVNKQCDSVNGRLRFLAVIGAVVIIGAVGYLAYETYKHESQARKISADLHTLEQNEKKLREEQMELLEEINERTNVFEFFMDIRRESFATVQDVFQGSYKWDNFTKKNILPHIDHHIIAITSSVQRCTNNSLEIVHKVISGSSLQNFTLYKFDILGSIDEGKYIQPLIGQHFVKYYDKWAAFDKDQCWEKSGKDECTITSLEFSSCTPSNISACPFTMENVDENFLKFTQVEDTIQFVTTIPIFQVKNEKGGCSKFIVPSNGKVTVTLAKTEILIVGNHTFGGKSEEPSKITFHTTIQNPNITEALRKQNKKMNDAAKDEEKHNDEIQNNPSMLQQLVGWVWNFLLDYWIESLAIVFVVSVFLILFCCTCSCCKKAF